MESKLATGAGASSGPVDSSAAGATALTGSDAADERLRDYVTGRVEESVELALHRAATQLEEQVFSRTLFEVRAELRTGRDECLGRIARVAAAVGLDPEGGGEAGRGSAVRTLEGELRGALVRLEGVETREASGRTQAEVQERAARAATTALQQRVEDCYLASEAMVGVARERAAGLENLVRQADLQHRDALARCQAELTSLLEAAADQWTEEQAAHKRRVVVVEKLVESLVDKIGQVRRDVQSTIAATPEYKRLQQLGGVLDRINADVAELQSTSITLTNAVEDGAVFMSDTRRAAELLELDLRRVEAATASQVQSMHPVLYWRLLLVLGVDRSVRWRALWQPCRGTWLGCCSRGRRRTLSCPTWCGPTTSRVGCRRCRLRGATAWPGRAGRWRPRCRGCGRR